MESNSKDLGEAAERYLGSRKYIEVFMFRLKVSSIRFSVEPPNTRCADLGYVSTNGARSVGVYPA